MESCIKFFSPIDKEIREDGNEVGFCKVFQLPIWHPFRRPVGGITGAESNGNKVRLKFSFPVGPYDFVTCVKNNWLICELFEESLEKIASYFVNGTLIGDKDGQCWISNGPKEFTWTFKEPEGQCASCGEKIDNKD